MNHYQPFQNGPVYRMRHGSVWADLLLTDQLMAELEYGALEQLRAAMELPGVERVTLTPDAHYGYGVPIGTTLVSETHLYPDTVGPDPACSVALSRFDGLNFSGLPKPERRDIINKIHDHVQFGNAGARAPQQETPLSWTKLRQILTGQTRPEHSWVNNTHTVNISSIYWKEVLEIIENDLLTERMLGQIGSIGGGNHFVELQEDEDGTLHLMTHFGSRGLGAAGAKFFEELIRAEIYKWTGTLPSKHDLLYVPVDSQTGDMYLAFQQMMLEWASYNHAAIHDTVSGILTSHFGGGWSHEFQGHIPHNFIEERGDRYYQRKGATPAYLDSDIPLLVPGSMSTASYVLRPGPNAERYGASVPHGSGRTHSRSAARKAFDQEQVNQAFDDAGVLGNFRDVPLDESAGAYKDVDEVIQALIAPEIATVEKRLRPVAAFKGA